MSATPAQTEHAISLRHVSKSYGHGTDAAVEDLSLDVPRGATVMLVGPSGCGKTTTLKMINRLIEPSSGTIEVDGHDVMRRDPVELRRGIGYVIQHVGLLPHRTIYDNIATVPQLLGWDRARIRERVHELATLLDLDEAFLERYPAELSGGQRQRVGVARALGADPPILLMDEPFGAVDPIVRARLQDEFAALRTRLGKTVVFVTHDVDEAIKLGDRIAIMNVGGRVEQYAPPEEILRDPASEFVERFVGAERGLKRLSLIRVADVGVEEGPVVAPGASADEARRVIDASPFDWAAVVEDGELFGWVDRALLDGAASVADARPRRFSAYVTASSSLREALDAIVTSRTRVAVVASEGQRYLGILTIERISREIVT
ncbi:MAG: ABC transporter ATP-binding protein [Actinomycetota bacterium]